jgi:hypothetical protein
MPRYENDFGNAAHINQYAWPDIHEIFFYWAMFSQPPTIRHIVLHFIWLSFSQYIMAMVCSIYTSPSGSLDH